jgi:hypothetical protein
MFSTLERVSRTKDATPANGSPKTGSFGHSHNASQCWLHSLLSLSSLSSELSELLASLLLNESSLELLPEVLSLDNDDAKGISKALRFRPQPGHTGFEACFSTTNVACRSQQTLPSSCRAACFLTSHSFITSL